MAAVLQFRSPLFPFSSHKTPRAPQSLLSSSFAPQPTPSSLLRLKATATPRSVRFGINRRRRRATGILCEAQAQDTHAAAVRVPEVTDVTWKSLVLESDTPVLVEFWAPWCGPCRMIHPVIDELAKEYVGKLKCYKLNTDQCPSVATEYGIRSIPTTMILKNGEKKDAVVGAVPKTTLTTTIDKYL